MHRNAPRFYALPSTLSEGFLFALACHGRGALTRWPWWIYGPRIAETILKEQPSTTLPDFLNPLWRHCSHGSADVRKSMQVHRPDRRSRTHPYITLLSGQFEMGGEVFSSGDAEPCVYATNRDPYLPHSFWDAGDAPTPQLGVTMWLYSPGKQYSGAWLTLWGLPYKRPLIMLHKIKTKTKTSRILTHFRKENPVVVYSLNFLELSVLPLFGGLHGRNDGHYSLKTQQFWPARSLHLCGLDHVPERGNPFPTHVASKWNPGFSYIRKTSIFSPVRRQIQNFLPLVIPWN